MQHEDQVPDVQQHDQVPDMQPDGTQGTQLEPEITQLENLPVIDATQSQIDHVPETQIEEDDVEITGVGKDPNINPQIFQREQRRATRYQARRSARLQQGTSKEEEQGTSKKSDKKKKKKKKEDPAKKKKKKEEEEEEEDDYTCEVDI